MLEVTTRTLAVDLDGTLIRGDVSMDALARFARESIWHVFLILIWACRGKAHVKHQIALRDQFDPSTLSYNQDVVDLVEHQKANGGSSILVTGSHHLYAEAVADHTGLFSAHLGTNEAVNLTGAAKLAALEAFSNDDPITYLGDSSKDLPVWKGVSQAICMQTNSSFKREVPHLTFLTEEPAVNRWRALAVSMRPRHWVKNSLLFLPMLLSHDFSNPTGWLAAAVGFLFFSVIAGAVYIGNDILDAASDRKHAIKRHRPIANHDLPPLFAGSFAIAITSLTLIVAFLTMPDFAYWLLVYFVVTSLYSIYLKRLVLLDVVVLAALYLIRLFAGAAATDTAVSFWLLLFSLFIFLSLAIAKRVSELIEGHAGGRAYRTDDRAMLTHLGTSAAMVSVLVLGLYVDSDAVTALYRYPMLIWGLCPLLVYWIGKLWLDVTRGQLTGSDPVLYTLASPSTWLVGVIAVIIMAAAK